MKLNRKKRTQGFSLIELLIVVTIILILAAIAIPKLLTVKQTANATAAVANTKSILQAATAYDSQYNTFPPSLADLGGTAGTAPTATGAELLDATLAGATASVPYQGYDFTYALTDANDFTLSVDPANAGSGNRHFFTDQSDVIRWNDGSAASVSSPPIGTNGSGS